MLAYLGVDNAMWQKLLDNQKLILAELTKLEGLIMALVDDLKAGLKKIDDTTNLLAANVDVVKQIILDLQAQIANGTISPTQLSEALTPVADHLTAVSDALAAVAAGGAPVVPPVEPL